MAPILSQAYGYGFSLGLGAAFALLMAVVTKVLSVYLGQVQNSERFSTASRNVRSGLISSSTVSAWTWPATLLTSGAWCYSYGISGGFLYGAGGTVQIGLFLFLAIQIKRKAPSAHTMSECFSIRYGKAGHWMFLTYCVATNVLISSLLLLGGSQGFAATTGMHTVAASFLLPVGVVVYTALGGLKATFVSDWIHTVIIYGMLLATSYRVYCSSPLIGSPGKMYELLQEAQALFPVESGESYLSFKNKSLMFLSWAVTIGGFSSVFGDPGYSQRAIAAEPSNVFKGYLFGALCWWVIPMSLGSSAGLAARVLLNNPASITYPNVLSDSEVSAGLPVIYGMAAVFGKSGAAAGLMMLFMSVTSATSAELIAFSSVMTYDVYRSYIKPDATGTQLVKAAHISVIGFGLFMAVLSTVFNYIGVTVGWLLSFLGIVLSPEVSAITLTIFWNKMTKLSLLISCPLGTLTGIGCWIGSTYYFSGGVINKETVMISQATFIGNITSLLSTPIYIAIISFIKPDEVPFDLNLLNGGFQLADDVDQEEEKAVETNLKNEKTLNRQSWYSLGINFFILIVAYIAIPCGLYGSSQDFSKRSFTAFIVIMLIWLVVAAVYIVVAPLWQGRKSIMKVVRVLLKKEPPLMGETLETSETDSVEEISELHQLKV